MGQDFELIVDNINDESEFFKIVDKEDIFNKRKIKIKKIQKNDCFPNDLLDKDNTVEKSNEKKEKPNIWDILNDIKKSNHSETLENLSSEHNDRDNKYCINCKSEKLIEDQNLCAIVCFDCGMVNTEILDSGIEFPQYNSAENNIVNRCGCPSNFFFPKSSQGTIIVGNTTNRLRQRQNWDLMVYRERSLNNVFEFIADVCKKNNIQKIILDSTKILYKKINDCKHKTGKNMGKQIIIRGENRISIIAACFFKACELNKQPKNIKTVAALFSLTEKKVSKGNKQYDKILRNSDDVNFYNFSLDITEDFINTYGRKLKLDKKCIDMAITISHNAYRMKLATDHNPQSVAAGIILTATTYLDLDIKKKKISKVFGTSDITTTKIFNKITPYVDALIDNDATEYIIKKFKING